MDGNTNQGKNASQRTSLNTQKSIQCRLALGAFGSAFKSAPIIERPVFKKKCSLNFDDPHIILLLCAIMGVRK
jgi:hypothetical protein